MKRSTKWPGSSLTERFSLENPSVGCCPAIFYSFRWPAPEKEQVLCLPSFRGCPKWRNIRSISEFSTSHVLLKVWRLHMDSRILHYEFVTGESVNITVSAEIAEVI